MKHIKKLCKIAAWFFGLTFAAYWFNLDAKLVHKLYPIFTAHYDRLPRDKKL